MEVELSIITVNYNGLEDTCALIDSITFNDELEVIVVDNGSRNDEAKVIAERYPQVKTIRSEQNLGFAGGNNIGIKAASGRYLYFINNDTVLNHPTSDIRHQPSDIRHKTSDIRHQTSDISHQTSDIVHQPSPFAPLIARLKSSANIGIVCPKIRFAWAPQPIQFAGYTPLSAVTLRNRAIGYGEDDHGQYNEAHPTPYAHGAAMMVSRQALERVGLMPECYFLYYEELDWSVMFRRAGYEIWYEPAATIYHKESQSTGADSPLKTYYVTRNRLLFASRNCKGLQRYATYCYLLGVVGMKDAARHLLKGRTDLVKATWQGIADFCFRPTGKKA